MDNPTILIPLSFVSVAIIVVVIWYLRYRQNKLVAEQVRRSPHSYIGGRIYQIRIADRTIYATPPPTFSKAIKCPFPPNQDFEQPPPTYQEYLVISAEGLYGTNYPQQLTPPPQARINSCS